MIGKIPVRFPFYVVRDPSTNTIYVANPHDNAVYVIDGTVNKVVAKVMFNINPLAQVT